MINIRGQIFVLISTLPYTTYSSRVDTSTEDLFPLVNVLQKSQNRKQISHDLHYQTTTNIIVECALADTEANADNRLDALVNDVLNIVMSNVDFISQFEAIDDIDIKYGFKRAGETDLSCAEIHLSFQTTEKIEPVFLHNFTSANVTYKLNDINIDNELIYMEQ